MYEKPECELVGNFPVLTGYCNILKIWGIVLYSDFSYSQNKSENNCTAKRKPSALYPLLLWISTDFMCHFVENHDRNYGKQIQSSVFSTFERVNRLVVLSDMLFFLCYSDMREYTWNLQELCLCRITEIRKRNYHRWWEIITINYYHNNG
jgi:hypothetical protein